MSTVAKAVRPRCLAGERACPPEDCGGPHGYAELVAAIADPKHERHDELAEWADGFDPEAFDLPKGGRALSLAPNGFRDSDDDDDDLEGDGNLGDAAMSLPRQLVDKVLKLEPMQRASLAALIAGSLADEVIQARNVAQQLISSVRAGAQRPTGGRGGWVRDPAPKTAKLRGGQRRK